MRTLLAVECSTFLAYSATLLPAIILPIHTPLPQADQFATRLFIEPLELNYTEFHWSKFSKCNKVTILEPNAATWHVVEGLGGGGGGG